MTPNPTRRKLLTTALTTGTVSLAGCASMLEDEEPETITENHSENPGNNTENNTEDRPEETEQSEETEEPDNQGLTWETVLEPHREQKSEYADQELVKKAVNGERPGEDYGVLFEHPEYFEQLADAKGDNLTTEGVSTGFVEQNTGWTTQIQSLYTAEKKYDPGQTQFGGMDSDNCNSRTLEDGTTEDCHSYSWWNGSVGMTNLDGYQEESNENHQEAWSAYNAGAIIEEEIRSPTNPSNEDQVFPGGFVGKCEGERYWTYSSNDGFWSCEGTEEPDGPTPSGCSSCDPVNEPNFGTSGYLPDTETYYENGERKKEIGLIQFPYLNQQSTPDHVPGGVYSYPDLSGGAEITEMVADCWAGGLGEKPDNIGTSDRGFSATATPSTSEPWGVSDTVNFEDRSTYSCEWGYHTEDLDSDQLLVGDSDNYVIEFHKNQDPGNEYYTFWESLDTMHSIQEEYGQGELPEQLS